LLVDEEQVDAERFERAARRGSALLAAGDAQGAARTLANALDLWRGPALSDLAYEEWAQGEASRLDELRLMAVEDRVEAELAVGRHTSLVAELEQLVLEHPSRERYRAQLMLALYRSGRQSDALAVYRRAARFFASELGVRPGAELRAREQAILRHDPSLRLDALAPGNLPAPPTRLIGRRRELEELGLLLSDADTRLVTLLGPGGSGKTRLAIECARRLQTELAGAVFVVDLAPLAEPGLLLDAVARTVGFAAENGGGGQLADSLTAWLRHRRLLVVLDNFEHLSAAAPVVAALLAGVPGLTLLATSRRPLRIRAEWRYQLEPLPIGDAVALFDERARAARRGFETTTEVEALCRRLDGLPLAIELAAAHVATMTPAEILAWVDRRADALDEGPRDAPARQRTLHATLDWSCRLLGSEEQRLFARLGVFAGGCTLEAAESVCGAERAVLGSLVGMSLLQHNGDRYSLLETVRDHARERLEASGEAEKLRALHAEHFLRLAEHGAELARVKDRATLDRLEQEQPNLRAALASLGDSGQVEANLRLACSLFFLWFMRGGAREGLDWLERALASGAGPPVLRWHATNYAATLAALCGDPRAAGLAEQSLKLARAAEDDIGVAYALQTHGNTLSSSDTVTARRAYEECAALFRQAGNLRGLRSATHNLGLIDLREGDYARARARLEEALRLGFEVGAAEDAIANSFCDLGFVALFENRVEDAGRLLEEGLRRSRALAWPEGTSNCLIGLAAVAESEGAGERAALLLSAADALTSELGFAGPGYVVEIRNHVAAALDLRAADAPRSSEPEVRSRLIESAVESVLRR
jgi:predicted ATPase